MKSRKWAFNAKCCLFCPYYPPIITTDHRKILVIDGKVGYRRREYRGWASTVVLLWALERYGHYAGRRWGGRGWHRCFCRCGMLRKNAKISLVFTERKIAAYRTTAALSCLWDSPFDENSLGKRFIWTSSTGRRTMYILWRHISLSTMKWKQHYILRQKRCGCEADIAAYSR